MKPHLALDLWSLEHSPIIVLFRIYGIDLGYTELIYSRSGVSALVRTRASLGEHVTSRFVNTTQCGVAIVRTAAFRGLPWLKLWTLITSVLRCWLFIFVNSCKSWRAVAANVLSILAELQTVRDKHASKSGSAVKCRVTRC
jgi:hypothetical protein